MRGNGPRRGAVGSFFCAHADAVIHEERHEHAFATRQQFVIPFFSFPALTMVARCREFPRRCGAFALFVGLALAEERRLAEAAARAAASDEKFLLPILMYGPNNQARAEEGRRSRRELPPGGSLYR